MYIYTHILPQNKTTKKYIYKIQLIKKFNIYKKKQQKVYLTT